MEPINISLVTALGAGFASFLSPCVLPMVPIYLAGLAGPEILEKTGERRNLRIFLHSLVFVAGFTMVFILLGAGAGLAGMSIAADRMVMQQVASIILIVFGAFLLLSRKIPQLNFIKHFNPKQTKATGYLRSFITGIIFTLVMGPCVGPILGPILTMAAASETASQGTALLAVYSLGVGIPFLIIGAAFDAVAPFLRKVSQYSGVIYVISGIVLVVLGILSLTGKLALF